MLEAIKSPFKSLASISPRRKHETAEVSPVEYTYHGHRKASFSTQDIDELTELRARQRTFEGAYQRTSLSLAAYGCLVLKIFSSAFAKIGICYVTMAFIMILISFFRRRNSDHDFADQYKQPAQEADSNNPVLRPGKRVWGREFKTVGNLVILMSAAVALLEIAIFVLIMRL